MFSIYVRKKLVKVDWRCSHYNIWQPLPKKKNGPFTIGGTAGVRCLCGINQWDKQFNCSLNKTIEKHWSPKVCNFRFDENSTKEKLYVLSMFPYPSGHLHMGHLRVYGTSDVLARYFRMAGKNVLHPMGWDAFGLPAENAAMDGGVDPDEWTQKNIATMKSLMEEMNFSFDWDREFATCDSDYYKWTQFLFLKLYESGLAYRAKAYVNWDPVDKTVLADEQVDSEGRSWRSGAKVEKKIMRQWFINTTKFAESLYEGLNDPILKEWRDVINIQKHWIGEINGTIISFEIVDDVSEGDKRTTMPIWMKRAEHVEKAAFVAVRRGSFWTFGCEVEGLMPYAVKNPFTGGVLPVYLTEKVPFPVGADTYLGVPEVNPTDKEFADHFKIPYRQGSPTPATEEELEEFGRKICAEAREKGIGGYPASAKLKDWLISRQRYWGTPIPIIHCPTCGEQPVPEKDLPVRLPKVKTVKRGENPLLKEKDWVNVACPKCGGEATRETDTMDTFVDSAWYYLRFLDPDNERAPFDVEKVKKFTPVDIYVGGKEHATLHLYYARFMNHFLHSVGLIPHREPFSYLLCQGMVKSATYSSMKTGEYVKADLVEKINDAFFHKDTKELLTVKWEKMSKSKHNAADPKALLQKYGIDATRLVVLSGPSYKSDVHWEEKRFWDIESWQRRLWLTISKFIKLRSGTIEKFEPTEEFKKLDYYMFDSRNFYLKKITFTIEERFDVAVAIAKLQGLTGSLRKCNDEVMKHSVNFERALALQIFFLAPFAPCFASELWSGFVSAPNRLCNTGEILWDRSVFEQPWPRVDDDYQYRSAGVASMLKLSKRKKDERTDEKISKKKSEKKLIVER